MKLVNIVVGMTEDRMIGDTETNDLPWPRIPADMKLFRELTTPGVVIMGRNTKESIPEKYFPLEGRENIVVSSTLKGTPDYHVLGSLQNAIEIGQTMDKVEGDIWVIGGARLYAEALPLANQLHVSSLRPVPGEFFDGNVYFPEVNWDEWEIKDRKEYLDAKAVDKQPLPFVYKKFERK